MSTQNKATGIRQRRFLRELAKEFDVEERKSMVALFEKREAARTLVPAMPSSAYRLQAEKDSLEWRIRLIDVNLKILGKLS